VTVRLSAAGVRVAAERARRPRYWRSFAAAAEPSAPPATP
jgi:hypothetical protein